MGGGEGSGVEEELQPMMSASGYAPSTGPQVSQLNVEYVCQLGSIISLPRDTGSAPRDFPGPIGS